MTLSLLIAAYGSEDGSDNSSGVGFLNSGIFSAGQSG